MNLAQSGTGVRLLNKKLQVSNHYMIRTVCHWFESWKFSFGSAKSAGSGKKNKNELK